jgi:AcrR family transcriptional regulator
METEALNGHAPPRRSVASTGRRAASVAIKALGFDPGAHGRASSQATGAPRGTAEDRLMDAVTKLAARGGYAQLTVERVLEAAGVSRASFYRYFANIDDCFAGAYRRSADHLLQQLISTPRRGGNRQLELLEALVGRALAQPDLALLLMREGVAAGQHGLFERDALICRLEQELVAVSSASDQLDIPLPLLLGGVFRLVALRLGEQHEGEDLAAGVGELGRLFLRLPGQRWSGRLMPRLPDPKPLPPLASRLAPNPCSTRERILHATARQVRAKGYGAVTVADIVATAGTSRRSFYNEFQNKPAAFVAAYEHAFERTVAACAPLFFSAKPWPERVWDSAQGFTSYLSREPFFAYLGFVECYAVDAFVPRVNATQLAFTLFLEDGYRQRPEASFVSRECSALTAEVIFEAGFQVCRADPALYLPLMLPLAVYVALGPFIGTEEAGSFVARKLDDLTTQPPAAEGHR